MQFVNIFPVDLDTGPAVCPLNRMYYGNKKANRIGAALMRSGTPVELGGSCSGTAILANGGTVALTGTVSGFLAYVELPQACYAVPGPIKVFVTWTDGTEIVSLVEGYGTVVQTETGTVIDPGTIIPSVSALISEMETVAASIPTDYSVLSAMMDALTHIDLTESGYINGSGAEGADENYRRTGFIPVAADSTLILDGFYTGAAAYAYMFYSSGKEKISGAASVTTRTVITSIPTGAVYVRFSSRISAGETPVAYVSYHLADILAARLAGSVDDFKTYAGIT